MKKLMVTYWYGDKDPNWLRMQTLETFRRYYPDWELALVREAKKALWLHEGSDEIDLSWYKRLRRDVPADLRSDVFRWGYLANVGGWFSDLDVIYLRDGLVIPNNYPTLHVTHTSDDGCAIGVVAGRPSDLTSLLYDLARQVATTWVKSHPAGHQACGGELLRKVLRDKPGTVGDIPAEWFYPQGFRRKDNEAIWSPDAPDHWLDGVGLHWGGGHDTSRRMERIADPEWAKSHSSLVARAWRKAMGNE